MIGVHLILGITEMKKFRHIVEFDEEANKVSIFRQFQDGTLDIYTETELPDINACDGRDRFEDFARQLGENLLMDSPVARKLLSL